MVHQYAVDVINYIEASWGEPLSPALAEDISRSSDQVLAAFVEGWPSRHVKDRTTLEPPTIERGQLRPVLGASWDLEREKRAALALLLYVPSVSVSAYLIHLHWYLNTENFAPEDGRARMRRTLEWLAHVRPLILDGSIYFGGGTLAYNDFEWRKEVLDRLLSAKKSNWRGTPLAAMSRDRRENELLALGQILLRPLGEVIEQRGSAVGLNAIEDAAYEALLKSGQTRSGQLATLAKLAEWDLPTLSIEASNVVSLRSADSFAEWRNSLDIGLRRAADIESEMNDVSAMRGILAAEMEATYDGIRRELDRSRGLGLLRIGWRGVGIGALVGASSGLVAGDALTGSLAAAGLSVAGSIIDGYLTNASNRAQSRAIWDTVLSFREVAPSASR